MAARRSFKNRIKAEEALRKRVVSVKNRALTAPTAANKARAQARNKAFIKRKAMYPDAVRSIVYNSKKVPVWGTPKPPTIVKGKRVSAVVGDTRTHQYSKGKPVIKSVARTTQDQPIRRPASKAVRDLARQRALPTDPVARRTQVRNNARALSRLQNSPAAKLARGLGRAAGPVSGALLAYDAYKSLDAYSKTSGPEKQMAKYKAQGGFSHMTSNPNKRGKQGLDY